MRKHQGMEEDELAAEAGIERWLGESDPMEPGDRTVPIDMIDLERVPQRLWRETLAAYPRSWRGLPIRRIVDPALQEIAWEVANNLDSDESTGALRREIERGRARRRGAPLPVPGADHASARSTVQLNTRLRADDHARLRRAAGAVGLRPTTLARALVLNGVALILREHPELASEH